MFLNFKLTFYLLHLTLINCVKYYVDECRPLWHNYRDIKCIRHVSDTSMTHSEAISECRKMNSTLVSIGSEAENLFITSLLYGLDSRVKGLYIDLGRKLVNDSPIDEFGWSDGTDLGAYSNWAPGEPSPYFEPCVELYSVDINAGKWNDLSCGSRRYGLCQQWLQKGTYGTQYLPKYELCEHLDYIRYRNNCYKAYDDWSGRLNWDQANRKCQSDHRNGSLLFIEDSYEYSFIKYWTQSVMSAVEFWIGLHANNNTLNLHYQWVNEWPVYHGLWASHEPKYWPNGGHQCVAQERVSGVWRSDAYCDDRRAFVCKVSEQLIPSDELYKQALCPVFVNSTTKLSAPEDQWINLHKPAKHCHWFSDQLMLDWKSASDYCAKRNGQLVSIHSGHESELLKPFVQKYSKPVWIGLYQSPSGNYRWEDGSAQDFHNWSPGEPNNETTEVCVEMRAQDMMWNDIKCRGIRHRFVCDIQKVFNDSKLNWLNNLTHNNWPSIWQTHPGTSDTTVDHQLTATVICLLVFLFVLVFVIIMFMIYYNWRQSVGNYCSQYCFCLKVFNGRSSSYNTGTTSGSVSNRSSTNEQNLFDIR